MPGQVAFVAFLGFSLSDVFQGRCWLACLYVLCFPLCPQMISNDAYCEIRWLSMSRRSLKIHKEIVHMRSWKPPWSSKSQALPRLEKQCPDSKCDALCPQYGYQSCPRGVSRLPYYSHGAHTKSFSLFIMSGWHWIWEELPSHHGSSLALSGLHMRKFHKLVPGLENTCPVFQAIWIPRPARIEAARSAARRF